VANSKIDSFTDSGTIRMRIVFELVICARGTKKMYEIRRISIAAILLSAGLPQPAFSQANVMGVGNLTCKQLIDMGDNEFRTASIISWVGGFASALNMVSMSSGRPVRGLAGIEPDYITKPIIAYCTKYPEKAVFPAIEAFIVRLPEKEFKLPMKP